MRFATALSMAALLAGCKLTNDTVMVATLLESPAPPPTFPVIGQPVSVAAVFLAQTDADLGSPPSQSSMRPISGANVTLVRDGIGIFPLAEVGAGSYEAVGDFYIPGATYRFEARVGSETFWAEVQGAPAAPNPTLNPPQPGQQVLVYARYGDVPATLTLHHCTGVCAIGIYGVWPVPGSGSYDGSATPSCHNLPSDAAGVLALAFLDDSAWRVQDFTLSKSPCFPALQEYPGGYVVGLASMKKGATSGNLSAFSAVMVGSSGAAAVVVNAP